MIPSPMTGAPQGMPTASGGATGNTGSGPAKVTNDTQGWYLGTTRISEKAGGNGPKQEPSKAPLPSGYSYDANGRIVMAGKTGGAPAKQEETVVVTAERKAEDLKVKQAPSRAPLPAGYAYDANGRIGFVGTTGATSGGTSGQKRGYWVSSSGLDLD